MTKLSKKYGNLIVEKVKKLLQYLCKETIHDFIKNMFIIKYLYYSEMSHLLISVNN